MEEEHSTINNSNEIIQMTSSNSHRLQIRRGILRQTTTLRSSPYNSSLSNLRRRQQIASQTINNLITNIENDVNTLSNDQIENEIIQNHLNENNHDDFQVLADLTIPNENNNSNESYHSLSTVDFDSDDDHQFYYTTTSIPIFDYSSSSSSSSSSAEPLIVPNNPIDTTQYQYDDEDEYSPSRNNDDEDLSIEIILESSQNNSLSPIPRRRRSIIPSNPRGLRLSDILSIPQKMYSSLKQQHLNDKYPQTTIMNTHCYICLEDFQSIDSIKILNCQHIFHTGCINEWLRSHSNCAYCRTPVVIDMPRSTRRRQRTRNRRANNTIARSSTNNLFQPIPNESSTFEQP